MQRYVSDLKSSWQAFHGLCSDKIISLYFFIILRTKDHCLCYIGGKHIYSICLKHVKMTKIYINAWSEIKKYLRLKLTRGRIVPPTKFRPLYLHMCNKNTPSENWRLRIARYTWRIAWKPTFHFLLTLHVFYIFIVCSVLRCLYFFMLSGLLQQPVKIFHGPFLDWLQARPAFNINFLDFFLIKKITYNDVMRRKWFLDIEFKLSYK
jgi:hypothetical protein